MATLRHSSKNARGVPSIKLTIAKTDVSNMARWLKKQCEDVVADVDDLMKEAADYAKEFAQEGYDDAQYAGDHDAKVTVQANKRHQYVVTATGESVKFIEGGTNPGPKARKGKPLTSQGKTVWFFTVRGDNFRLNHGGSYVRRKRIDWDAKFVEQPQTVSFGRITFKDVTTKDLKSRVEEYNSKSGKFKISAASVSKEATRMRLEANEARTKFYEEPHYKDGGIDKTSVVTVASKPQKIMSQAYEQAIDKIEREIGRI